MIDREVRIWEEMGIKRRNGGLGLDRPSTWYICIGWSTAFENKACWVWDPKLPEDWRMHSDCSRDETFAIPRRIYPVD